MIEFKHPQELEILKHYATLLNNERAIEFLNNQTVTDIGDVTNMAKFYWSIVDLSTEEDSSFKGKYEDMDMWLERIFTSLHIYFNNIGYGDVWDHEIP